MLHSDSSVTLFTESPFYHLSLISTIVKLLAMRSCFLERCTLRKGSYAINTIFFRWLKFCDRKQFSAIKAARPKKENWGRSKIFPFSWKVRDWKFWVISKIVLIAELVLVLINLSFLFSHNFPQSLLTLFRTYFSAIRSQIMQKNLGADCRMLWTRCLFFAIAEKTGSLIEILCKPSSVLQ